jgi:exopolysaccharide biosynthesis polyprenyl glycosylphosphotransferase
VNVVGGSVYAGSTFGRLVAPLERVASRWRFVACVQLFDLSVFFLMGLGWFRIPVQNSVHHSWLPQLVLSLLIAAMIHCVFQCFRLYDFNVLVRGREAAFRAFCGGLITSGPFLAPLLIQQDTADPSAMAASGVVAVVLLVTVLLRFPLARLATVLQQSGIVGSRFYIISDTAEAGASLRPMIERFQGNKVVGMWDLSRHDGSIVTALEGALDFLRVNPVDAVILKVPLSQTDNLVEAAQVLRSLPRMVLLAPSFEADDLSLRLDRSWVDRLDEMGNTVLVKLSDRPLAGWLWVVKEIQDRALALLLLIIVAPALLGIAVAIKISDPGPILFRQKRFGYRGDTFDIIKFRTMRVAPVQADASSLKLTVRDDPRVFPVGRILRKTSLDELPQLWNVLRGDMWIIGPRPHSPFAMAGGQIYAKAVQGYAARYRIKPGITGWAQVCGWRGPTDTLEQLSNRVQHDLYYIENWTPIFDAKILVQTLLFVFGHQNAF